MVASGRVAVVGSANLDLVTLTETLPKPGETVLATAYSEGPGGKGSNQAHAAARMGASVCFVGLRGDDAAGALLAETLSAEGVDVSRFAVTDGPSGRALVMVDQAAENSIIVVAGSNALLSASDIERANDVVADADVVVCQLEIPLEAVQAARKACTGTFILNPAPARTLPDDLLSGTDVLIVNETEYETVLGTPLPQNLNDIADVARRSNSPKVIVATLGARGAAVSTQGAVTLIASPAVTVIDSTGAGDTFVGTLAAELALGSDVLSAARTAVVAASLSTQRLGAIAGMPHRDEVLGHLALSKSPEPA